MMEVGGKSAVINEKAKKIRDALRKRDVLIVWKPEYELGISVIDEQHRAIVATINSLYYAVQNDLGNKMLTPVINMVHDYTRIHFDLEESHLVLCAFPEAENHRLLHRQLMRKLSAAGEESLRGQDHFQFLQFLNNWWIDHICTQDFLFRDYLNSETELWAERR